MNIAVFASGKGTNLQAIINAVRRGYIKAKIALVISDRKEAYALVRARRAGIKELFIDPRKFVSKEVFEKQILKSLKEHKIDLIALAGFMRIVGHTLVKNYKNRILNIHPALLPSFKGTQGIRDALGYGVKVTGSTVHLVDEEVDHGPIIIQAPVEIKEEDDEESLAKRIHRQEHRIYPLAIKLFVEGRLKIEGRKVKIKGHRRN